MAPARAIRMSRRSALLSGAFAAAGLLAAACAQPAPTPTTAPAPKEAPKTEPPKAAQPAAVAKSEVTLALIGSTAGIRRTAEEQIFKRFTESNPNVKVQHLDQPAGGSQSGHDYLVTIFSAKDSSMDIASIDTGSEWPAEFAPAGWLEPIDDILPKAKQEKLMPQMVYQSTINGKIYALPYFNDVGVFYVRKDLLEQSGKKVPVTWQEMVETAKAIAKPPDLWGHIPCYRKDEQLTCNLQEFFWSNNADMTDKDGKITINSPPVIEAVQFAIDLIKVHKITPDSVNNLTLDEGRQIFTEGKSVFHRNWAFVWNSAHSAESKVAGKVSMESLPKFGPNGSHVTNLGGWSWAINAFSKKKDEAKALVSFLGEAPQQTEYFITAGRPAAHMDVYSEENLKKFPPALAVFAPPYFKVSLTARARPRHPQYREISEIIQNEAQAAILGQRTAKEACDNMAKLLAPILTGWKP